MGYNNNNIPRGQGIEKSKTVGGKQRQDAQNDVATKELVGAKCIPRDTSYKPPL